MTEAVHRIGYRSMSIARDDPFCGPKVLWPFKQVEWSSNVDLAIYQKFQR